MTICHQHGPPGSGKTSIIYCLAGELQLDIYTLSLSRPTMDDSALNNLISSLPERCILLIEDIDAALRTGLTRDMDEDEIDEDAGDDTGIKDKRRRMGAKFNSRLNSQVTLSGLLNALDGIGAQEGRILFATTNVYSALDPALIRPGRMDIHIEFKLASKYQIRELFKSFYLPHQEEQSSIEDDEDEELGVDNSELEKMPPTPSTSEDGEGIEQGELEKKLTGDMHHAKIPSPSRRQVTALAEQFADRIPEHEFSMAAIQGYLMMYKTRPAEAVHNATAWVEKERTEKEKKGM